MNLKVGDLKEHIARRQEGAITAKLGDFTVNDDATLLSVTNGGTHQFSLDEITAPALAKFLKIPRSYYANLDPDFRAVTLCHHLDRHREVDAVVESLGGDIVAVHQPSQVMLPLSRVAGVVEKTFEPEDTIRRMISEKDLFHLDVTTNNHKIDLHKIDLVGPVPGDITEAGMRFLAHPFRSERPSVGVYAERLVCSNGMTTSERLGNISIKGLTVDEVIASMEQAVEQLLGQLDNHLTRLAATRNMSVPGSVQAFAAQLARETKLGRRVLDAVLAILNQIPEPTVWDVNQAFTTVANQVTNYRTMVKLQTLGGSLAFDAGHMLERCGTCERLL